VQKNLISAGAAINHCGCGKLHINGLPTARPGFRSFTSGYCHILTSLTYFVILTNRKYLVKTLYRLLSI